MRNPSLKVHDYTAALWLEGLMIMWLFNPIAALALNAVTLPLFFILYITSPQTRYTCATFATFPVFLIVLSTLLARNVPFAFETSFSIFVLLAMYTALTARPETQAIRYQVPVTQVWSER